jgi:hypothetical protein
MMTSKMILPNFLDVFLESCDVQIDLNELENLFEQIEAHSFSFSKFISLLTETKIWQSLADQNAYYKQLCYYLALEIECFHSQLEKQPAYHSISHFIDVCFSVSVLCAADLHLSKSTGTSIWITQKEDYWLLLFCAIGHDYGHDGRFNTTPQQLEKKSIQLIDTFLDNQNLDPGFKSRLIKKIEPIILATDPQSYPTLFLKFSNQDTETLQPIDYLSMLIIEADILASVLPKRGLVLSQKLSLEWSEHSPKASAEVITKEGRLRFLNYVQFLSPQSRLLGINNFQQLSKELSMVDR